MRTSFRKSSPTVRSGLASEGWYTQCTIDPLWNFVGHQKPEIRYVFAGVSVQDLRRTLFFAFLRNRDHDHAVTIPEVFFVAFDIGTCRADVAGGMNEGIPGAAVSSFEFASASSGSQLAKRLDLLRTKAHRFEFFNGSRDLARIRKTLTTLCIGYVRKSSPGAEIPFQWLFLAVLGSF